MFLYIKDFFLLFREKYDRKIIDNKRLKKIDHILKTIVVFKSLLFGNAIYEINDR